MRLLVVGANGLLGSNVVHQARRFGWDVSGTYHSSRPEFDVQMTGFDLREYDQFGGVLDEHDPEAVVNCAAMTDVDACETNEEIAHLLNGEAPRGLASHCRKREIEFVHVSTDYVFEGASRTPYTETSETGPVQEYGKSKLVGEQVVRDVTKAALIIRLSFVWGIHRSNNELTGFPAWVREQLQSEEEVPLFTDQWVTPTRAGQASETVLQLLNHEESGCYHVACSSCVTLYEFGTVLAETMEAETDLLIEGSVDDVKRDATRPEYTCLNVEKVESALGREQPSLRADVESVREVLD